MSRRLLSVAALVCLFQANLCAADDIFFGDHGLLAQWWQKAGAQGIVCDGDSVRHLAHPWVHLKLNLGQSVKLVANRTTSPIPSMSSLGPAGTNDPRVLFALGNDRIKPIDTTVPPRQMRSEKATWESSPTYLYGQEKYTGQHILSLPILGEWFHQDPYAEAINIDNLPAETTVGDLKRILADHGIQADFPNAFPEQCKLPFEKRMINEKYVAIERKYNLATEEGDSRGIEKQTRAQRAPAGEAVPDAGSPVPGRVSAQ